MSKEDEKKQEELIDAILERPYGFEVCNNHFYLYPVTLGKSLLLAPLVKGLKLREEYLETKPFEEAIRSVNKHRQNVLQIIAYHTFNTKEELFQASLIKERMEQLDNASVEDLTTLLVLCLTKDNHYESFIKFIGLEKQNRRKERVIAAKKSTSTFIFGGTSLYGTLIDAACERYGWTYDYVVWGISYINLRMMLADQVTSIFLSEEEAKKAHLSNDNVVVNADDPKNKELIKQLFNG